MGGVILMLTGCQGDLPTREEALRTTQNPRPITNNVTSTVPDLGTGRTTLETTVADQTPTISYPNQANLVLNFLSQLSTGHLDTAIRYLPEAERATWYSNLASIQALAIIDVKIYNPAQWTETQQQYQVTVNVTPSGDGYTYGWENGENLRYLTLRKIDDQWLITDLAPQP